MNGTDRYSDAESKESVPDVLTREQINEFDDGDSLDNRNDIERRTVNQRLSEMNKQISELTKLVLALTEKMSSSNRERTFWVLPQMNKTHVPTKMSPYFRRKYFKNTQNNYLFFVGLC